MTDVYHTGTRDTVYNFEVEGFHTYHVGELGVWVHNANCGENFLLGKLREARVHADLKKLYPQAKILKERILRDSIGVKVIDELTGTGRRLDFVVVKNGKAIDVVEATGLNVDKTAQLEKKLRILQSGGNFVRDRATRELIDLGNLFSRVERRP